MTTLNFRVSLSELSSAFDLVQSAVPDDVTTANLTATSLSFHYAQRGLTLAASAELEAPIDLKQDATILLMVDTILFKTFLSDKRELPQSVAFELKFDSAEPELSINLNGDEINWPLGACNLIPPSSTAGEPPPAPPAESMRVDPRKLSELIELVGRFAPKNNDEAYAPMVHIDPSFIGAARSQGARIIQTKTGTPKEILLPSDIVGIVARALRQFDPTNTTILYSPEMTDPNDPTIKVAQGAFYVFADSKRHLSVAAYAKPFVELHQLIEQTKQEIAKVQGRDVVDALQLLKRQMRRDTPSFRLEVNASGGCLVFSIECPGGEARVKCEGVSISEGFETEPGVYSTALLSAVRLPQNRSISFERWNGNLCFVDEQSETQISRSFLVPAKPITQRRR